VTGNPTFR